MVRGISLRLSWILCIATLVACGCGSGSDLRSVYGNVTLDDRPVATGTIEFTPLKGTKGPLAGASIQDSRYEVPQQHGVLVGGTYKVSIVSMKKTGRKVQEFTDKNGKSLDEFANFVPAQFNSATTLQVKITD